MMPYPNPNYYTQPMMAMPQATKFVDSFEQIGVNDVPMDGKWVLFGKNDMSMVQARCWTPQGTIQTLNYKLENNPIQPHLDNQTENLAISGINDEIKAIYDEIKALNEKVDSLM